ncbi:unnamed protein product [Paramecium pentaurelia]|uniref:ERCC4 domain-containing protein n=1 Tax=Paramecium pentaurelia TaxID=43138 RepID=A0A8S1VN47_9CILI|nr:unnamed protein product [Paramecium pentaurelia]
MNREIWSQITHNVVDSIKSFPNGGLMILTSGLSIANLTSLFLTYFLEKSKSVIILLNYSNQEIDFIDTQLNYFVTQNQLNNNKEYALSVVVLTKLPSDKRATFYKQGGIFSITPQILMQDLLTNTLSPFIITHLIIQQVHQIKSKYDYESWITNFIKIVKPELFLLAFTNQPSILQLQQNTPIILKNFYLNNIIPWPMNRAEIVNCLKQHPFKWSEIKINLNKTIKDIQEIIISLIKQCIQAVNGQCGTSYLTSDMVIQQNWRKLKALIQRQSFKIDLIQQQIFLDIFQLRKLLFALINQSAYQFYFTLTQIINDAPIDSIWYISQPEIEGLVIKLQKLAQERDPIKYKFIKQNGEEVIKEINTKIDFKIEIQSKYLQLTKIIDKISQQNQSQNENLRIWIWVQNNENVTQIQQFLVSTYRMKDKNNYVNQFNFLRRILEQKSCKSIDKFLNNNSDQQQSQQIVQERKSKIILKHNNKLIKQTKQIKQEEETLLNYLLYQELEQLFEHVLKQEEQVLLQKSQVLKQQTYQLLPQELLQFDLYQSGHKVNKDGIVIQFEEDTIIPKMTIVVNNMNDDCQRYTFKQTYKPDYIIMMEPNHSFLKELLINQNYVETILLMQNECVEFWQYYKEKMDEEFAFEQIIEHSKDFSRSFEKPEDAIHKLDMQQQHQNSRQGKGEEFFQLKDIQPSIFVDYREFRCDVPPKLYFHGFQLTPVMLKVGDIILSNNCAIERKSVETGDLIESINQNRLDQQLQKMNSFDNPFLLIEYSDNIPFCLGSLSRQSQHFSSNTRVMVRLLELITKFSKIQILWSNNSDDTIKIICKLKQTLARNSPDIKIFKTNIQQQNGLLQNEKITDYFTQIEKEIQ